MSLLLYWSHFEIYLYIEFLVNNFFRYILVQNQTALLNLRFNKIHFVEF